MCRECCLLKPLILKPINVSEHTSMSSVSEDMPKKETIYCDICHFSNVIHHYVHVSSIFCVNTL